MNILVTGATGQLGKCLHDIVNTASTNNNYIFTSRHADVDNNILSLDITNENEVIQCCKNNKIDVIVNCAAWTNVDGAESSENYESCQSINAIGPNNLANAIKITNPNGILIHISTDYVFGGDSYNTPCTEDMECVPIGVYGATKLAGEIAIQKTNIKYLIIRTSWLYSEYGKNFLKTMQNLISHKDSIHVVFDQCGTPTYAGDLADCIFDIIEYNKLYFNETCGIYNYSNEGVCSWYDFAQEIKNMINNDSCVIYPCHSDEFPSPVKRPSYSVLDKTKIKMIFNIDIPYWKDSLKKVIDKINAV